MASTTLIFDILAKDRASGTFKAFGREIDNLDKKARGLSHFGDIGGKVALGATAGIAAIIGVSANFEKSMSGVKAATGEASDGMDALRDAALQAGADTAFSASEAAAGIENLAKAGVSTQDILGGGLTGALDLAAAGGIDVAVAAESAASAMTQFGLAGKDVPHIADLLAAAAGKAQGEVTDMAAALNQSGLVADQVGLSIEETTGALGAFASAGLLGSDAGTSFKTMLGALTPNSAKAKSAMEELGISAYDAQGNFIGLSEFAGKLQDGLSTLTDEQRQATLETIFGSDAVRAAAILYEQGADGVQTWIDKVDDSGFAAEQAHTKLDNLSGDFEALRGSLETALIGAGEGSQGPLRKLVQGMTDAVNAFNNLPGPAQSAATGLLAVTAVLGGGLWATSKVVTGIANTRGALADLGATAPKTAGALRGLVGVGTRLSLVASGLAAINAAVEGMRRDDTALSDLARNLEAIANGDTNNTASQLVEDIDILGQYENALTSAAEKGQDFLFTVGTLGQAGDTSLDNALQGVEAIDEALAGMVESGNVEMATKAFDGLMQQILMAGGSQATFISQLDSFNTAMENHRSSADGAADPTNDLAGATEGLGDAADGSRKSIQGLVDAMLAQRDAALAAFDAETAYRQALKDANKQAKDNNAGIAGNTEKALANREALSGLASAWNNQSAAVRNSTGEYRSARTNFLDVAQAMGVPIEKAIELADSMFALPKKTVVGLDANDRATAKVVGVQRLVDYYGQTKASAQALLRDLASGKVDSVQELINKFGVTKAEARALLEDLASGKLREIIGLLDDVDGTHTSSTHTHTIIERFERHNIDVDGKAGGGLIAGPGTSTSDSIPVNLSNGEYVIKAAAVDRYGVGFFDRANSMTLPKGAGSSRQVATALSRVASGAHAVSPRRMVVEVRVVGELDTSKAKAQLEGIATEVFAQEIQEERRFERTQR